MVEISCINCGEKFTEEYETFSGIVRCRKCNKTMQTSIINKKVVLAGYDPIQMHKDFIQVIKESNIKK